MEAHDTTGSGPVPDTEEPGLVPDEVEVEDDDIEDEEDNNDLNGAAGDVQSVMSQLREQREDLKEEGHTLDLDVPGYNGMLVARYRPVRFEIIEKITKRAMKESKKRGISGNLLASTDTLIEACEEVMLRVNGVLTPIPTGSGVPVRYDSRLAEAMGFEASDARQVIAGIFGNEFGVIEHNVQWSRWLRDVTKEVDEDLLGE